MRVIKVISATALSEAQQLKIETFFKSRKSYEVSFEYTVDKTLIAGISVLDGNTVYDGSYANKLHKIKDSLK